jgi:predicted acyltransferase
MRIASIDILRALTMLLMIWVNDFWTLTEIPKWLKHANATEDYLGFSDIIFPLFLFIVGLSIPLAIKQRRIKGGSRLAITKHIIIRSISLLIIGVFMVNYETAHHDSLIIGKFWWCMLMAIGVGLIWMHWKRSPVQKKWHAPIQLVGLAILIFLAVIYKGGSNGEIWMATQWWGILGLIGWAYLINAIVFVLFRGNFIVMTGLFLALTILSVLDHSDLLPTLPKSLSFLSTIYTGTIPAFTSAGIVATLVFRKLSQSRSSLILPILILLGILTLAFGIGTKSIWGINKIQGTPSWLGVCTGIGFILFAILFVISDVKKKTNWAKFISPAGTATLTCYMLPYIIYPLREITGLRLPEILNTRVLGLIGSFVFALLVVLLTGWFEKKGYKLKL